MKDYDNSQEKSIAFVIVNGMMSGKNQIRYKLMNHSTNRAITLDIMCPDNLCNFNIYNQIKGLSNENISTFISFY